MTENAMNNNNQWVTVDDIRYTRDEWQQVERLLSQDKLGKARAIMGRALERQAARMRKSTVRRHHKKI